MGQEEPEVHAARIVAALNENHPAQSGWTLMEQYGHRHPTEPAWYALWKSPDGAMQAQFSNGHLGTVYWTTPDGEIEMHFERGQLHLWSATIPAVRYPDGTMFFFVHGKRHRVSGPSEVHPDGLLRWHRHGLLIGQMHADGVPRDAQGNPVQGTMRLAVWRKRCRGWNAF